MRGQGVRFKAWNISGERWEYFTLSQVADVGEAHRWAKYENWLISIELEAIEDKSKWTGKLDQTCPKCGHSGDPDVPHTCNQSKSKCQFVEQLNSGPDNMPPIESFNESIDLVKRAKALRAKGATEEQLEYADMLIEACDRLKSQAKYIGELLEKWYKASEQLKATQHNMTLYADERNELHEQLAAKDKETKRLQLIVDAVESVYPGRFK